MRKFLIFFGLLFSMRVAYSQPNPQPILIFDETFETPDSVFASDTTGPGTRKGNNIWVINKDYTGNATYPNTTNENSVYAGDGTITDAPYSTYLHIYDSGANPPDSDANFNPSSASDQFVYTVNGFCTLELTADTLVFFYICQGDTSNHTNIVSDTVIQGGDTIVKIDTIVGPPKAYGQVYYRADGGPWIQTGEPYYYNQTDWRYTKIADPGFNNVANLQIGFRWVNLDTNIAKTISFSVDDIQMIAQYDSTFNPVDLSFVEYFTPKGTDTVCREDDVDFYFEQSAPLCEGTYVVQLSDSGGNFSNPLTVSAFQFDGTTAGAEGFWGFQVPVTVPYGRCYEIRIVRTQPGPKIVGQSSVCFTVVDCANTITTLGALVLNDPDTACMLSAIDISFYSTGPFFAANVYTAQLGIFDSLGNFIVMDTIGSSPDPTTYDPSLGSPPGTVSGLIPVVPPGCNYYMRVVSSDSPAIGTTYGPFCLKDCDMLTNNHTDIHLCISQSAGVDTTIVVKINEFTSTTHYHNGNLYALEILSMLDLSIINIGGLAAVYDSVSNTFKLIVPDLSGLAALGLAPGSYYARIVADSTNTPYDTNGTIIRLTIGAPSAIPVTLIPSDTVACNGAGAGSDGPIQGWIFTPDNPASQYFWIATWFNNALPYKAPQGDSTLLLNFANASPDIYCIRVREENFGCYGPFSASSCITIITKPTEPITGPPRVCEGDTVKLSTSFLTTTYYSWSSTYGKIIDTANNQITVRFDSAGTFGVSYYAINQCGGGNGSYKILVVPPDTAQVIPDSVTICSGQQVQLSVSSPGDSTTLTTTFASTGGYDGIMFDVSAQQALVIDSFDGNFGNGAFVPLAIYYKLGSYNENGAATDPTQWTQIPATGINDTIRTPNGQDESTPIPGDWGIAMQPGDTIAFYITTTNGVNRVRYSNGTVTAAPVASDNNLSIYEGAVETYSFSNPLDYKIWNGSIHYTTHSGINYLWSNGAVTPVINVSPPSNTSYTVKVIDSVNCVSPGAAKVLVNASPVDSILPKNPNICLGAQVHVNAAASDTYYWTPTIGIPDSTSLTFTLTPDSTITYYLMATNSNCASKDSLKITVDIPLAGLDTDSICTQKAIVLQLPNQLGGTYNWSTGDTTQSISVNSAGVYSANYRATGDSCISRYIFDVITKNCNSNIQVPEAFTPTGANRHFTVFGQNIMDYEINIYNRWGEQVYHSADPGELNDLSKGWDGTYHGKEQNMGTYVYYIKAKDVLNNSSELHGNLELIR